jgi:serine/threonine protein kinase/class 3 adenylate cyclase
VIRILELALEHDPPFAVRQWAGETTLASLILKRGPLPEVEVMPLVYLIAGGVTASHSLGLAHGRIGPGMVRLDGAGSPRLDFTGVEVHSASGDTLISVLDASCQAPEVVAGATPSRASDVFSLGALMACLLTGPARPGTTQPESGWPGIDVSSHIGSLIRDMTAPDPDDRPLAQEVVPRLTELLAPDAATCEWTPTGPAMVELGPARDVRTLAFARQPSTLPARRQEILGRFQLLELLGEGGQGAVYRAIDTADGSIVALKVLSAERAGRPEVLKRFRKEARLLAEANNPHVVNLLEFNEEDGVPYLVLEFVAGKNLGDLIAERKQLEESTALEIMADVARALAGPHDLGIIHRDVKPANILLFGADPLAGASLAETVVMPDAVRAATTPATEEIAPSPPIRVKLSDFGLARHVVDTQSLAVTAAGAMLGTPHYMAPEQWTGLVTDSRTDVYAMGATLFHMLAGRPPFSGQTRDDLLAQHCHEPAPPMNRFNPAASEGTARLIEKALAKNPADRYPDAAAMLRDLDALRHGTPTGISLHPRLPASDPSEIIEFEWAWELGASPRELWPHVSNTERVNRALGLPAPDFTSRIGPQGNLERYAAFRKIVPFSWREHPFEWIEGQRFGVLREFQQGLFQWFQSSVELQPSGEGGTRLTHRVRVLPRGMGGRLMAHLQLARGGRRALEKVYRRIDAAVMGRLGDPKTVDPFEEAVSLPDSRKARLEQALDRLGQLHVEPAVIERLGQFLEQAPDPEVARIRPLALAGRWELDPDALISACLHGAREGLLVLLWDLLCPVCRVSSEIKDTLRAIRDHGHCPACNLDFPLDFASSVELVFRVHPEIRQVDLGTYCIGGPAHSPHVLVQVRVAAGERIELALELLEGTYRIRGPQLPWSAECQVQSQGPTRLWEIILPTGPAPDDGRILRAGHQVLTLCNPLDHELLVRVERTAVRKDALTAARAASLALFRELFPGEVLSPGRLATVSIVTLVAIELAPEEADRLYLELGDARAFNVLQDLFGLLDEAIRNSGGAVVKTIGESLLAAFSDPVSAVHLCLRIREHLATHEQTRLLHPRVAVHRGAALATNLNDHLDYFGTTARQVLKLASHLRANELALTHAVAADPEVAAMLAAQGIEPEVVSVEAQGLPHYARLVLESSGCLTSAEGPSLLSGKHP